MHSKWQIWDFFSSFKKDTLATFEGVLCLSTFDPICLKLVKDHLLAGAGERVVHYKMASEVTRPWLEEEFQTLSLFGNTESFFIHQAQDLKAELLDLVTRLEVTGRFLILSFESETAAFKKIAKDPKSQILLLEAPKFWEPNKLLDFSASYFRLPLSFEAKSWILEALENNLETFYHACSLLKLNHPQEREVSLSMVTELLTLEKLDQFHLASMFARKKKQDFYEKLVNLTGDFEKMRGFFNFLQSHLIKMADPSYLSKKPRLTSYDKDLQSTSKLWKTEDLMVEIGRFNDWEILSKKKDSMLWHKLREAHLESFGIL
ncbi:MAG TPA: hypothetical protein VNJ01_06350 [Bacteriovoracaceae bacterium]|nr:hypothetical protein [Bacteriovoracaceae bacterium]